MSNIYVSEPSTNGKVVLKTTVGDIEIELWSKECPKACRNFVQLCMERYYDDTAFHRLVRGFIVQGGDPSGTGEGGESIYGKPFKTETHSRLSFNRRGLVGMACLEDHMNGSQFFFTLGPATELNGKHTLFGRVVGETLYNMLRLGEGEIGKNDKPERIHRVVSSCIILNPYDDIVPRSLLKRSASKVTEESKVTAKATKNFSLLSFGEEAEEEEQVIGVVIEKLRKKGKSAHDLLSDPGLSSEPVSLDDPDAELIKKHNLEAELKEENRRRKLLEAEMNDPDSGQSKLKRIEKLRQESEEIRRQIAESKRDEMKRNSQIKSEQERKLKEIQEKEENEKEALARWGARAQNAGGDGQTGDAPLIDDVDTFSSDLSSYRAKTKQERKKGAEREAFVLSQLETFGKRLKAAIEQNDDKCASENDNDEVILASDDWMRTRLISEESTFGKQVLDPSVAHPDRYDLYDPRNPLNVRKRGGGDQENVKNNSKMRFI